MNDEIEMCEITERENLAVFYKVESLEPIPNKDRIELVHLKDCGYTVICEKGHKVGDLVVFIKYDSIVPDVDLFSFMKEYKFRVKPRSFTERDEEDNVIKKIYSQGIVITFDAFKDYLDRGTTFWDDMESGGYEGSQVVWREGNDVTKLLGIKKYIPPVIGGKGSGFGVMAKKGDFPTHIVSKTDEMNLASKIRALDEIIGKDVYITQKIEGSSLTTMWDESRDELMVCSRNNQIGEHETNKFWQAVNKYDLKNKMSEPAINFSIQAELYGSGIQKNKLGIEGVDLAVFNITEKVTKKRLNYYDMVDVCKWLGIPMVPVVKIIKNFQGTFDELQALADEQVYPNGEAAEGIVIRPIASFFSKVLKDDWSVKVINREYKL